MLRISKLASYATIIITDFAKNPERLLSAKDVAALLKLAAPTVSKILKILLEAGFVQSTLGTNGGYQLAKKANEITLYDIISAFDGAPALTACCTTSFLCTQNSICTTKNNWQVINAAMVGILKQVTIEDMASPLIEHPLFTRLTFALKNK